MKKDKVRAHNVEDIRKFNEYLKKGLTYPEINKLIPRHERQYRRWKSYIKRGILELSTT